LRREGYTLHWGSDGRHALYRNADEPGESVDLASSEPERVRALANEVDVWLRRPARRGEAR